jgi:hypothetical protein
MNKSILPGIEPKSRKTYFQIALPAPEDDMKPSLYYLCREFNPDLC